MISSFLGYFKEGLDVLYRYWYSIPTSYFVIIFFASRIFGGFKKILNFVVVLSIVMVLLFIMAVLFGGM